MKKRDLEGVYVVLVMFVSFGNFRGSERRRLSRFFFRRLFYFGVRIGKFKFRISLDLDFGKFEMSLSLVFFERDFVYSVYLMSKLV